MPATITVDAFGGLTGFDKAGVGAADGNGAREAAEGCEEQYGAGADENISAKGYTAFESGELCS